MMCQSDEYEYLEILEDEPSTVEQPVYQPEYQPISVEEQFKLLEKLLREHGGESGH